MLTYSLPASSTTSDRAFIAIFLLLILGRWFMLRLFDDDLTCLSIFDGFSLGMGLRGDGGCLADLDFFLCFFFFFWL